MKNYKAFLFALPVLACVAVIPAYAANKEPPQAAKKLEPIGESALRSIIERGAPAEEQNRNVLAPLVGEWNYKVSVWSKSGSDPAVTTGKITSELIMGDRYLSSDVSGNLNIAGHDAPINAQGLIGYDTSKKAFTSVWIDTLNMGMMIGSGKYDEKKKVLTETGRFTDPLDGVEKSFRSEIAFPDAGKYKRTIFAVNKAGKEAKLMEFEYTRKN